MFRNRFLIVARCFSSDLEKYFEYQGQDYICSRPDDNGMHSCSNLPPLKFGECIFDILFIGFPIFFPLPPPLFLFAFHREQVHDFVRHWHRVFSASLSPEFQEKYARGIGAKERHISRWKSRGSMDLMLSVTASSIFVTANVETRKQNFIRN